jgi:transposase InsO family protein
MPSQKRVSDPEGWARLRFAIIGPLLADPPPPGQLGARLRELAAKHWRHPVTGLALRLGFATLERWYYLARDAQDPVAALRRRRRRDADQPRGLNPALIEALRAQHREHPGWTVQLHYDNLAAWVAEETSLGPFPSYATVRRFMKRAGLHRRRTAARRTPGAEQAARRLAACEVRSYEAEHVHALWHLDFHHGSRKVLTRAGSWATPLMLAVIDDHSRLICHLQWYLDETTETLVHGLTQALQKRGLPRALMSDNGSAMQAEEFSAGLHALGILHEPTLPYSPYQNAKQESFWATLEGRLMAMLEGVAELSLERLNLITQAWVEQDYHRNRHTEIATTPLKRYLDAPNVGRPCPDSEQLRRAFRARVQRRQRRSDGTLSLEGKRFEVPARFRHLETLHLAYARWDLSAVELLDPHTATVLCPIYPLDKTANASGQRRRLGPVSEPQPTPASPTTLPPLLRKLLAEYAATGLPPAYLPKHDDPEPTP